MRTPFLAVSLSTFVCAAGALAGLQPPIQLEVIDNGGISDGSGANLAGSTTYDVFLFNNTGSNISGIVGFDLGSQATGSPALYGIPVAGTIFNHSFGTDTNPSPALIPAFPALAFDSFWTVGDQPVGSFESGSVDLTGADGLLNAQFTVGGAPIDLNSGERLRLARLTFLSGDFDFSRAFGLAAVLADGTRVEFGVPSPGAFAALTLGALAATRRRRP